LKLRADESDGSPASKAKSQPGTHAFTLVEVIVALTIFGTGIVAVFGAMRTCAAAAHHNRMLTGSVLLAESLLAQTRLDKNHAFQTKEGLRNLYSWKVQLVPTPVENLAAVKITVEWPEQQRVQAYELVSLIHIKPVVEGK